MLVGCAAGGGQVLNVRVFFWGKHSRVEGFRVYSLPMALGLAVGVQCLSRIQGKGENMVYELAASGAKFLLSMLVGCALGAQG